MGSLRKALRASLSSGQRQNRSRTSERKGDLKRALMAKRSQMARAATKIIRDYDAEWYGGGGPCDDIASKLLGIALGAVRDLDGDVGGWAGDHAFAQVWSDTEAFNIDIPYGLYETGGGYKWDVDTTVTIGPGDVYIDEIPLSYVK